MVCYTRRSSGSRIGARSSFVPPNRFTTPMSLGFKLLVPSALALYFAAACAPDLDSLSASYSATGGTAGTGGIGSSGAGNSVAGGMENPSGGAAPTACSNGSKDANESDVDCGGSSKCDRCATKSRCTASRDCESTFCKNNICAEPTCTDKVKNQDETGVDCGGSCSPCDVGVACDSNDDCSGHYCTVDKACGDHCLSGTREADETDKDCGGPSCAPCADKSLCSEATDCLSLVCSNNKCVAATCNDSIKNQDESATDCGGVCAATKPCDVGVRCNSEADCASWICSAAGKCTADIVVPDNQVLDNFEDGDFNLPTNPPREARAGNWYQFSDMTATPSFSVVVIDRGASHKGFETKGADFTKWGSGVGVDMAAAKAPYNASAHTSDASSYAGLTFWARAATALTVTVVFPDEDTDAGGKLCTACDHHYNKSIQVGTNWQRYTVLFADLILESGTVPTPTVFKPNALISVQFRMGLGTTYDLFLDDIAFVK